MQKSVLKPVKLTSDAKQRKHTEVNSAAIAVQCGRKECIRTVCSGIARTNKSIVVTEPRAALW